ncbi:MAG: NADH-quinone oxidoreductase subunit C [Verrucomicrobiae bacterium]
MTDVLQAIRAALPAATVELINNPGPGAQHSLLVSANDGRAVAKFLRDSLGFDFCSNVTGVDWLPRKVQETVSRKESVEGAGKEIPETVERDIPGFLEAVYHLYSISKKSGPLTMRMRTGDRAGDVTVPSLTPVWKSAEFQEREAYDLFGIRFEGHPDLRRILMWDGFADHPMRKDYAAPDDCEYEPTPHDETLARVKARQEAT